MDNFQFDQAEGLRRILAGPKPRVFTFLSSMKNDDKNAMLVNLCASLARFGSNAILLDASMGSHGAAGKLGVTPDATLLQVARGEKAIDDAILTTQQGFGMAVLAGPAFRQALRHSKQMQSIEKTFDTLVQQTEVLMVDAELDEDDALPLPILAESDIVVQVSDSAASIKSAYAMIKRLHEQLGRRPFSILATGATEQRAQVVYQNMAQAASRYLAISLDSIGFVPQDEHMTRAARLGRSVIDAFPLAGASVAFRRMAERFICSDNRVDYGMMARGPSFSA